MSGNNKARTTLFLPHNPIFQSPSNDVDGDPLGLVGEGHGADDLPAVHVSNKVPVHRPEPEVTASASYNTKSCQSPEGGSQSPMSTQGGLEGHTPWQLGRHGTGACVLPRDQG